MATNRIGDWIADARFHLARISDSPGLDAQVLVSHVLDRNRSWVVAHPEFYLSQKKLSELKSLLDRRLANEPLPYLIGHWEFYGLDFQVNPLVLIPRPETELLVDKALEWLHKHPRQQSVLDIGTGSGCIAICLAKAIPEINIIAVDFNDDVLDVARANAQTHKVENQIKFIQSDLFKNISGAFSLICANLPYIPTNKLKNLSVSKFEPLEALDGGEDGLAFIKRVITESQGKITKPGLLLLEIESGQKEDVLLFTKRVLPSVSSEVILDGAGLPRLLYVKFS